MLDKDLRLCYVDDCWAYFTDRPLSEQTGDDWDDRSYEHNAGKPYNHQGECIVKVAFDGDWRRPCAEHSNSPFSVDDINRGAIAWLRGEKANIPAGTSLSEFCLLIKAGGGKVYVFIDVAVKPLGLSPRGYKAILVKSFMFFDRSSYLKPHIIS